MKKVLYVILGLVVLYLILCLVGPKGGTVTRSITINSSSETVKGLLADLKFFQDQWSPWSERDPQMKVEYIGEMGKPGYGYSWKGNDEVGQGTLTVVGVNGDSLLQKLSFEGMGDSKTFYVVNAKDAATNVTWGISFDYGFMGRGMMLFMNMDKMMGADFEHGLDKLKKAVESRPAAPVTANYEVKELDWTETNFIACKREIVSMTDMTPFFSKHLPAIDAVLKKEKIQPLSTPVALYFSFDEKEMKGDVATGFRVAPGVKVKGYENYSFISSKVLMVAYYGDYNKIGPAHYALGEYIKAKNLPQQSVAVEEYVTDPTSEKDTMKWLTNVYYFLPATR